MVYVVLIEEGKHIATAIRDNSDCTRVAMDEDEGLYDRNVEAFREMEYPMLKGNRLKIPS